MDDRATGRPYTHAVIRRIALIAALLFVNVACGLRRPDEVTAPAGAIDGPWRPVPFALPGPITEAVDRTCRGFTEEFPQQARLVVIDARGAGRVEARYAGPNGVEATCTRMTIDATGRVVAGGGGIGIGGQEWRVLQPLEIEDQSGFGSNESSTAMGRAGAGIATVVIVMPGKPPVTASLTNGWYLAWWPGAWPPGTKIVGLDSLGQTVSEIPVQ
jgi:hypothetical protein